MGTGPRRHLSYASLVMLLAVDLLGLTSLFLSQLLAIDFGWAWLLAAGVTAAAMPALLWLADRVFAAARVAGGVPISGGTFP